MKVIDAQAMKCALNAAVKLTGENILFGSVSFVFSSNCLKIAATNGWRLFSSELECECDDDTQSFLVSEKEIRKIVRFIKKEKTVEVFYAGNDVVFRAQTGGVRSIKTSGSEWRDYDFTEVKTNKVKFQVDRNSWLTSLIKTREMLESITLNNAQIVLRFTPLSTQIEVRLNDENSDILPVLLTIEEIPLIKEKYEIAFSLQGLIDCLSAFKTAYLDIAMSEKNTRAAMITGDRTTVVLMPCWLQ